MNELLKKYDDPGKFMTPCSIGNVRLKYALYDLGISVSLMSKSVYERICIGELKSIHILL
jgi:hypothetical protein